VMRALRLAGGVTVLALGGFVLVMLRREKRAARPATASRLVTPGSRLTGL
jgi:hypothetical protein